MKYQVKYLKGIVHCPASMRFLDARMDAIPAHLAAFQGLLSRLPDASACFSSTERESLFDQDSTQKP